MPYRRGLTARPLPLPFAALTHPPFPESWSRGDPKRRAASTKAMLERWNRGLEALDEALPERDVERPLALYGEELLAHDRAPIPAGDMPAGSPPWMRSLTTWARRVGETPEQKRATIEVVVPRTERPWA